MSNGALSKCETNRGAKAGEENVSTGKPIKQKSLPHPVQKQLHNHEVPDNAWF
jgi:hypothetical protein